jgi:hypothetical protein
MNTCKLFAGLVLAVAAACPLPGLAQSNAVTVTAEPLPSQRLSLTTVSSATQTQTFSHPRGSTVRLRAAAAPGYQFMAWGQACSGSAPSCVLQLAADVAVSARFNPVLTAAVGGGGRIMASGINCGTDCTEPYSVGSTVQLTATPDAGQMFSGWSGACSGTAATCTVTMGGPLNVRATFAPIPVMSFALTVSVSGGGSVTSAPSGITCGSDCSEGYAPKTSVTLSATAAAGQRFTGWSGACTGTGPCTVLMNQARSVGAAFTSATAGPVYYFSDCQSGATAGCVAGNDSNSGTNPLAPRRTLAGMNLDALPAGSQLLFARGGVWNDFGLIISNPNVTAAQPLVISSYPTAWGGATRPTLRVGRLTMAFVFGWYQETQNDGGYLIRGLKLDGLGSGTSGIFIGNNVHDVLLEDLDVSGFHVGVQSQQNGTEPTQYTLRNSNIHHNSGMGLLGDGRGVVIENNLFEANNFSGSGLNHAIYLGGHGRNGIVRNNRFVRNSVVNGRCTGGNVTVHGQWDGLLIEGNSIEQDASDLGCYGVSVNAAYDTPEYFRDLVVRNNRIVNLGGCAVCLTSAPGAVVENNLIVNTQATYHLGVVIPDRPAGPGDAADGGAIIRNNTIVLKRAVAGSEAIALRANSGANVQVVSNLVYYGVESNPQHSCFSHQPRASYAAFDNNLCHHAGGAGNWSAVYPTPGVAAQAGFDVRGLAVDPLFVSVPAAANGWQDLIQGLSPARAAGHPTLSSSTDRLGAPRPAPSIGAREPVVSAAGIPPGSAGPSQR